MNNIRPIVTINGINESAATTTDRMAVALEALGFSSRKLFYPTRYWYSTRNRLLQYQDALGMLKQLPAGPVDVIAHSWGCLLAARMMELGGTDLFRYVFLFAPALDHDWVFPIRAFRRMWVVHDPHDKAVWAARLFFKGWHPWGDMGRVGYQGIDDHRIENLTDPTHGVEQFNHSHYFRTPRLERWARFVQDHIRQPL